MERKARDSIVDLQLQKAVIVKSESFLPTSCVVDPILPTAPLLLPGTSTKVLPVVGYDAILPAAGDIYDIILGMLPEYYTG
jgi:hypothetical protein